MIEATCNRVYSYVRTHKAQVRALLFFLTFVLVFSQASNIEDFVIGFYDGLSTANK
ncbi:MAG: hypothetical protein WKF61_07490 [Luteimonas sp.]